MNGLGEFANLYDVDDRPSTDRRPSHKQLQNMLPPDLEMPEILGKIDRRKSQKQRDTAKNYGESSSEPPERINSEYDDGALHRKLDRPTDSCGKAVYERNLRRYYEDNKQLQHRKRSYIRGDPPFDAPYRSDRVERSTEMAYGSCQGTKDYYHKKQPPSAYSYKSWNDPSLNPVGEEGMTIEISPGIFRPLRGAQETVSAIENGTYTVVSCFVCDIQLFCIEDCEMVVCPECKVVSPNTASLGTPRGVGLGLKV